MDVTYAAPVVAVDPVLGTSDLPTVASDNLHGGQLAGEHLIGLGHRRIGMLTGRPDLQSARLREAGFRQAMKSAGIPVDESLMCEADYEPEASLRAAQALLGTPEPPTALFAANDVSALVAMTVAGQVGLRIPEDLSVVGFDNIPEASQSEPGLTTIEQPIHLMGVRAVELLIRLIRGEAVTERQITLPTRLIERASTRRVRSLS
jgi:LacI family transcriptional regulator